ncbi:hypothetical protein HDU96_006909 [Phlyctochytrium bullatum]|nr:hypothetical protein HDU96_006909 [Phlyctochytrium bullatum]
MLENPNIMIAFDLEEGKHLYIKILRIPIRFDSRSDIAKKDAIATEINTCAKLSASGIVGLVKCDPVDVMVKYSEDLDVSPSLWSAIKMKLYMSSLTHIPQLTEKWLYHGFSRILEALKALHKLNLVHMDVKSDNVFVDCDAKWDLGDFGATRHIHSEVWECTEVMNPYQIEKNVRVIPAMDYVLLCVMIAVELKKEDWKQLCGTKQNVQEDLIRAKLNSIEDDNFKKDVVELFEHNLKLVREHLQQF